MPFFVLPQPQQFSGGTGGTVFHLTRLLNLKSDNASALAKEALLTFLSDCFDIEPLGSGWEHLLLAVDSTAAAPEGYVLTVSENAVTITGGDAAGVFYGVQTLKQLLLQGEGDLPAMQIIDAPHLAYRGLLLDCARCFLPKEDILRCLDAMALLKLNRLHWHLTDDQGWRLELYRNMLLSQIGGLRAYTGWNHTPHKGYYTKADVAEILAFAKARHIVVIPEIDMPGHCTAALAAYPALSCDGKERSVETRRGVHRETICLGKESTFDTLRSIFDEVLADFPDSPIHIGGDDVSFAHWQNCPHCQAKLHALHGNDETALYAAYIDRVARYLKHRQRPVLRWHDAADAAVSEAAFVEYRANLPDDPTFAIDAALHLDLPHRKLSLRDVYAHAPQTVYGMEACLWTERFTDARRIYPLLFPRLTAFCERAWSDPQEADFTRFAEKQPLCSLLLLTVGIDCKTFRHRRG